MNRRAFVAKSIVGVAVGLVVGQKAFAVDDPAVRELSAAFVEGVGGGITWSPQMAEFGQLWLRNRLNESDVPFGRVRDQARQRARGLGQYAAEAAVADGKSEIQLRHFQQALRRLADEPCPF